MKDAILWKRILNEGVISLGQLENDDKLERDIITAPIIVDTRYGEIADKGLQTEADEMAFPFPKFWIEGSDECESRPETDGARWGALVNWEDMGGGIRAVGIAVIASAPGHRPVMLSFASTTFPSLKPDGQSWNMTSPRGAKDVSVAVREVILYVFDNLALLSCKNVSLSPRDNDPKQVRRAIKRHGGNADSYRYHVLVVRPAGAKSDAPAQEIGIMPRHVCRGHFAEYGPEFNKGLLFGKYAGRFYVPPCVKGKKENGEVAKDYAIA
jgi:hypothetical protein